MSHGIGNSTSIAPPSAPGNDATVTLFDSAVMFWPKCLRQLNATMVEVTFNALDQDSAASGLKSYTSTDGGTNWVENLMRDDAGSATMGVTISSSTEPRTYRFAVDAFDDFRLRYTAGATGPSSWGLSIVLHCGGLAVQR